MRNGDSRADVRSVECWCQKAAAALTVYKSVGIAIQDMAVANMVYRKALEQHVGTEVDLLS